MADQNPPNRPEAQDAAAAQVLAGLPGHGTAIPAPHHLVFQGGVAPLREGRYQYASLSQMVADGPDFAGLRKVLLLRVVYYQRGKSDPAKRVVWSKTSGSKTDQNWDRILVVMCLNAIDTTNNCAFVTLNAQKSDTVFGQNLRARDTRDGFGPGAVVAIVRPLPIEHFFGKDDRGMPILNFNGGLKLVNVVSSNIQPPLREISAPGLRLQAFNYPVVRLHLENCTVVQTNCCGYLCDSVYMIKSDGSQRSSCPCYYAKRQLSRLVFDLKLKAEVLENGDPTADPFTIPSFISRSFTETVTSSGFPASVNLPMINTNDDIEYDISDGLQAIFDAVNRNGGFNVMGWTRRGRINDQSQEGERDKASVNSSEVLESTTALCLPTR